MGKDLLKSTAGFKNYFLVVHTLNVFVREPIYFFHQHYIFNNHKKLTLA